MQLKENERVWLLKLAPLNESYC